MSKTCINIVVQLCLLYIFLMSSICLLLTIFESEDFFSSVESQVAFSFARCHFNLKPHFSPMLRSLKLKDYCFPICNTWIRRSLISQQQWHNYSGKTLNFRCLGETRNSTCYIFCILKTIVYGY